MYTYDDDDDDDDDCLRHLMCLPNRCRYYVDSRFLSSCRHYYIHFSMLISIESLTFCVFNFFFVSFSLSPVVCWSSVSVSRVHHCYSLLSNDVPLWRERSNKLDSLPLSHIHLTCLLFYCVARLTVMKIQACRLRMCACACVLCSFPLSNKFRIHLKCTYIPFYPFTSSPSSISKPQKKNHNENW